MNEQRPPMNLNVDLSSAEDVKCASCGNYTFVEVVMMKKISALVSPTGKDAIIPIPSFACNACGWINREFMPALPNKIEEPSETRPTLKLEQ